MGIAKLISFYEGDRGAFYVISELENAGSLGVVIQDGIRAGEPLKDEFIIDAVSQILSGLKELHNHGIAHGNIKPSNILLFI